MIYVTGDCHADFSRFSPFRFVEQNDMDGNDYMIICGDFGGVWHDSPSERWNMMDLESKPFKILFVDGNHENFDRLKEYKVIDFCGGKAQQIGANVYHLMRGQVYTLEGKKFFTFGGAKSHDVKDGIFDIDEYENEDDMLFDINRYRSEGKQFRIKHLSWWREELPSVEEMECGLDNLKANDFKVDYVITHGAPTKIARKVNSKFNDTDVLSLYLDDLDRKMEYKKWFFGHYHVDRNIDEKHICLYENILRIE